MIWMRTQDNDCDIPKRINRACSPEKSYGFPKPRPMAWAGMTTHLRCSPLTELGEYNTDPLWPAALRNLPNRGQRPGDRGPGQPPAVELAQVIAYLQLINAVHLDALVGQV